MYVYVRDLVCVYEWESVRESRWKQYTNTYAAVGEFSLGLYVCMYRIGNNGHCMYTAVVV